MNKYSWLSFIVKPLLVELSSSEKKKKGKVYLHKFYLVFGIITFTVFLIPALITFFANEPIGVSIVFLLFSLLGVCLIIAYVNCRIKYNQRWFIYKNFFGVKRKYFYDQITAIKECEKESYIYFGKHKLSVNLLAIGGTDFIGFVKEKTQTQIDKEV